MRIGAGIISSARRGAKLITPAARNLLFSSASPSVGVPPYPAGVIAAGAQDAWDIGQDSSLTGPSSAPTLTLPADTSTLASQSGGGATYSGGVLTISGDGFTLTGWDFRTGSNSGNGVRILVRNGTGTRPKITHSILGITSASGVPLWFDTANSGLELEYCTFDASFAHPSFRPIRLDAAGLTYISRFCKYVHSNKDQANNSPGGYGNTTSLAPDAVIESHNDYYEYPAPNVPSGAHAECWQPNTCASCLWEDCFFDAANGGQYATAATFSSLLRPEAQQGNISAVIIRRNVFYGMLDIAGGQGNYAISSGASGGFAISNWDQHNNAIAVGVGGLYMDLSGGGIVNRQDDFRLDTGVRITTPAEV